MRKGEANMAGKRPQKITDADLARVGRGTPGGDWLRRYWLAISRSEDIKDIPVGVKVLGEELVLFRDDRGRLGLLGLHCAHRGSSLEYGDIECGGLRCPYHGWLFDVEGRCLEQPAEPKDSQFHRKVRQPWYPVKELGGLVFAYLGPEKESPPPLPRYAPLIRTDGRLFLEATRQYDYNWFNFFENAPDVTHLSILHRNSGYGKQTWGNNFFDYHNIPPFEAVETEFGVKAVSRKPGPSAGTDYIHELGAFLPGILDLGSVNSTGSEEPDNEHTIFLTPNDDDHFMLFSIDYYTGGDAEFFDKILARRYGSARKEESRPYDRRKYQAWKGSIALEDIVTQGTQGKLGERREQLGYADRGVILLRKMVREAIETTLRGGRPKGVLAAAEADKIVDFGCFTGVRTHSATGVVDPRAVSGSESKGERLGD
jgi:phenylpropionate dioxygenase-like ring-hydroxylating dioxygenase large terminal subunit